MSTAWPLGCSCLPVIESVDCGTRELPDESFHCRLGLAATPGCWIHHSRDVSNETFQPGPPQHPALLPGLLKVDDVGEVGETGGALLSVTSPMWILVRERLTDKEKDF